MIEKKIIAIVLWLIMMGLAGCLCFFLSRRTRKRIDEIKNSEKYEKASAIIVEKNKRQNEYVYTAQFLHNDETYKKVIWTSALKNNFKIGESVEMYYNTEDSDEDAYVSLGKKDIGKAVLLDGMSIGFIIFGIVGAVLVYINK